MWRLTRCDLIDLTSSKTIQIAGETQRKGQRSKIKTKMTESKTPTRTEVDFLGRRDKWRGEGRATDDKPTIFRYHVLPIKEENMKENQINGRSSFTTTGRRCTRCLKCVTSPMR
jgi:hypothetical protein